MATQSLPNVSSALCLALYASSQYVWLGKGAVEFGVWPVPNPVEAWTGRRQLEIIAWCRRADKLSVVAMSTVPSTGALTCHLAGLYALCQR